ncbi:MAG: isopentenyl phosphate kinase [Patescibacteria group bacterium]|nr:isopentenyl phosphate kinase [Patescibacteria group bacterium]
MNLIILKIGGSIITHKDKRGPEVNFKNLRRIVNQLVGVKKRLILIHGAGSFGHQIVKRTGINKGIKKYKDLVSFAETQRLQNDLNSIITKKLIEKGLPAFPYQASSHTITAKGRLVRMDLEAIKGLLSLNMIPVLYGVPTYDTKQGCSILSGDQIASFLAERLKATKIIMASDVDGVFTDNPKKNKKAKQIKEINRKNFEEIKKTLGQSSSTDVTGGMLGKVLELIKTAKKGIPAQIIDGVKKDNIKKALLGKKVGTIIKW